MRVVIDIIASSDGVASAAIVPANIVLLTSEGSEGGRQFSLGLDQGTRALKMVLLRRRRRRPDRVAESAHCGGRLESWVGDWDTGRARRGR